MKNPQWIRTALGCLLAFSVAAGAQENGSWRAASTTAKAITGDVAFAGERIVINFAGFAAAQIRALKPEELSAAFEAPADAGGRGNLYRVSIPADKKFLHHNTLCGSEETQWLATYVEGHTLRLAMFSGPGMPVLTPEALADATDLCGTYTYVR